MNLSRDWPVPAGFGVVALILGGIALVALLASGAWKPLRAILVGYAALSPPAIIVLGILTSWQPGQLHIENRAGTPLALFLCGLGVVASGWAAVMCAQVGRRNPGAAILGTIVCLLLIPLDLVALLAAGEAIAGASL